MAITLTTGATISIASAFSAQWYTMTSVQNLTEMQFTAEAGHGLAANDFIEVLSGWGLLDKRVVRVKSVSTNTITIDNYDTTNTNKYPTGSGSGTFRKITAWTALTQVKSSSASGGEQQFADVTAIDDVVAKQMPTIRGAMSMNIDCYDDPSLAWYAAVSSAADARTPYGLRIVFPNSSVMCANAYWSINKVPTMETNQALVTQMTLSLAAEPMRYTGLLSD